MHRTGPHSQQTIIQHKMSIELKLRNFALGNNIVHEYVRLKKKTNQNYHNENKRGNIKANHSGYLYVKLSVEFGKQCL